MRCDCRQLLLSCPCSRPASIWKFDSRKRLSLFCRIGDAGSHRPVRFHSAFPARAQLQKRPCPHALHSSVQRLVERYQRRPRWPHSRQVHLAPHQVRIGLIVLLHLLPISLPLSQSRNSIRRYGSPFDTCCVRTAGILSTMFMSML